MKGHIQKWGNSLAVRIPMHLSKRLQFRSGTAVSIDIDGEGIVLKKLKINLDEMLDQITPENRHTIQEDASRGREEW